MDGVKGRFDHFASGQGRVFISALGNNTVEVINLFGLAIRHHLTTAQLKSTIFAYPTGASDIGYML